MTTEENKIEARGIIGEIARIRERSNLLIEQKLRNLGIEGILPAHGSILAFLFQQNQPVPVKRIVEQVGRVKSTVTGMVNNLEHNGYVTKDPSAKDGRVILVKLTDKGRDLKPHFDQISEKLIDKVYGEMPQEDRETLAGLLSRVRNNMEK
ncbi:MAG: MarR family transcriptional regulator [Kiritimatiellales bacterium]|nr:MarR family transcriptional regulator [Kiritimatiellales bacterium]